jgi:hypothetical protein
MCSQNPAEVETVKNELLKAGIAAETRPHSLAQELGASGVELWVQDERDFFNAARLLARMQDRAAGRTGGSVANPQEETPERSIGVAKPAAEPHSVPQRGGNNADSRRAGASRHEELKRARSLLETGIEEMFARERELAEECASLRAKVKELTQALAQGEAAFASEIEGRAAAEKNLVEQISCLVRARELEREEWRRLKSQDDALKNAQKELDSTFRRLQAQQGAAAALKEKVVSLEIQRDEREKSLCNARTEALAEREARIAAEEQAERAELAQEVLKKQLAEHKEREQQMHAHVASLNTLFSRADTNGGNGAHTP